MMSNKNILSLSRLITFVLKKEDFETENFLYIYNIRFLFSISEMILRSSDMEVQEEIHVM